MSALGLYLPGGSWLHRLPAGAKLGLLAGAGLGSFFLKSPAQVLAALAVVVLLYASARIPPARALAQVRPLLWAIGFLAVFHAVTDGWARAVTVVGVIAMLVLLAGLVTLTTRTSALVDALVAGLRPLRRLGVDPERVALMLALGVRSVPVMVGLASEVREAQRARGLAASPRAFAVPLLVRALHHADDLGDALVARGLDD